MEWALKNTSGAPEEIARSANPNLRQFLEKKNAAPESAETAEGEWVVASPESTGSFSAVGYYFAKRLQGELNSPVGIINSSWGGTPSEAWTSQLSIASVPELHESGLLKRKSLADHPAQKADYVEKMRQWLKAHSREDRPTSDVTAFAGPDLSREGWVPVKLPGEVRGNGIAENGAVWLRKEIEATPGSPLNLALPIDGFDSVYWNGKLLQQTTWESYPGHGGVRRGGPLNIPADDVKPGKNILAIRLYQPAGPAKFTADPKAGTQSLGGEWLARTEFELPAVPSDNPCPIPPKNPPRPQDIASFLYDGMIHPIIPYGIRGVIWYQGESNAGRAMQYRTAFPLLIQDWRKQWNRGDIPFYFCQLAGYMAKKPEPGDSAWAELREAQSLTLALPKTGQAILIDIGESGDIHPQNKKDVGERLALIALANDYGKKIAFSGPVFATMKIEGGKAVLSFRHADGGLVAAPLPETFDVRKAANEKAPLVRNSPESQLEGFAICGADKVWHWADARIDGDKVIVSSPKVSEPLAVRYAWADNPTGNLTNQEGLPAGPFRTDDFPGVTAGKSY